MQINLYFWENILFMAEETTIINTRATKELKQAVKMVAANNGFENVSVWLLDLINKQPEIKKALKNVKIVK